MNPIVFKNLFLLVLFLFANVCVGQELELLSVEYSRYPEAQVKEADTLQVSFDEFAVSAVFPISKPDDDKKWIFLAGGNYAHVLPKTSRRPFSSNLFFLGLRLIAIHNITEKSKLLLNVLPAISTTDDARSFEGKNFLMQGSVSYLKEVNDGFSYMLGIISTSRFGSPIVVPLVGITHEMPNLRITATLPLVIRALWAYDKDFSYGLKFAVNGSQYNFDNETFNGNQADFANFSRVRVGPEIRFRTGNTPLLINLYGGITIRRRYEFDSVNADDLDLSLKNGPFFSVKLSLDPRKQE